MILVHSGVVAGIEGFLIEVEVDVRPGLPGFEIVGLPSKTVRKAVSGCARLCAILGLSSPPKSDCEPGASPLP